MDVDYYELLGVARDADGDEIRRAYKRLALTCHPDKVPAEERPDAEKKFKLVCEAYETLIDTSARAQYDMYGTSDGRGGMYGDDAFPNDFGPDAFAEFFGFSGFNSPPFGGGRSRKPRTENADVEIEVSLEDIYKGRVLKLSSDREVLCKSCHGSGARPRATPKTCGQCQGSGTVRKLRPLGHGIMTASNVPCEACRGRGSIYRSKDLCKRCEGSGLTSEKSLLEIYIPRGVPSGYQIVLDGKADEAYGKETGDIVVTVQVAPHPVFTRSGQDLHARASISLVESLTGFSRMLITSLDGRGLRVTVPRGTVTKPNTILRIANEGLPKKGTDVFGDLYLYVDVEFPDSLENASESLEALRKALPAAKALPPDQPREIDEVEHTIVQKRDVPTYDGSDSEPEVNGANPNCTTM